MRRKVELSPTAEDIHSEIERLLGEKIERCRRKAAHGALEPQRPESRPATRLYPHGKNREL